MDTNRHKYRGDLPANNPPSREAPARRARMDAKIHLKRKSFALIRVIRGQICLSLLFQGGTRCLQRVGKELRLLLPGICAFGESADHESTRIQRRSCPRITRMDAKEKLTSELWSLTSSLNHGLRGSNGYRGAMPKPKCRMTKG
jgi:hypothetical protein